MKTTKRSSRNLFTTGTGQIKINRRVNTKDKEVIKLDISRRGLPYGREKNG